MRSKTPATQFPRSLRTLPRTGRGTVIRTPQDIRRTRTSIRIFYSAMSFRPAAGLSGSKQRKEARMTEHKVGTREEWLAARAALLEEEKQLTRRSDELARNRQALPWVPVENDYRFETEDGAKTFAELFEAGPSCRLSLHVRPDNETGAGCPGCTSRRTTSTAPSTISAAGRDLRRRLARPLENLARLQGGWAGLPVGLAAGSDFNLDFCGVHGGGARPAPASTSGRRSTRLRSTSGATSSTA